MNRITKGALCAGALGLSTLLTLSQGLPAAAAPPIPGEALTTTAPQSPSQDRSPSHSQIRPGVPATTEPSQAPASAEESTGIVLIGTQLGYEGAAAAGTGVLLDDSGTILTNNHVIADSTSITVTLADTGASYEATVIGSDPTEDVAVLTIDPESVLEPAEVADDAAAVGDAVTAVGNSEGGGALQAADGTVTALDASLTTSAQGPTESESLSGMIEVDADIVSGDSGGALLDADGDVVGITTAASQGSADITGYAIPIDRALDVAQDILDGVQTDTNTLGYPAFLGVALPAQQPAIPAYGSSFRERGHDQSSGSGAAVSGVYRDTPAAAIGLAAGDTITAVDGSTVTDGQQLSALLDEYEPGNRADITWVDSSGRTRTAAATFAEGPAD